MHLGTGPYTSANLLLFRYGPSLVYLVLVHPLYCIVILNRYGTVYLVLGSPSQYWIPYGYHYIIVPVRSSVWHKIVYRVSVRYETPYGMVRYVLYRIVHVGINKPRLVLAGSVQYSKLWSKFGYISHFVIYCHHIDMWCSSYCIDVMILHITVTTSLGSWRCA